MNKAELIKALAELLADKMEMGEEPTNREIISEFVECDDSFAIMVDEVNEIVNIELSLDFWNAPYKAEKPETCKGCLEPCIMYEPDMRGCKKKVKAESEDT